MYFKFFLQSDLFPIRSKIHQQNRTEKYLNLSYFSNSHRDMKTTVFISRNRISYAPLLGERASLLDFKAFGKIKTSNRSRRF